MKGRSALRQKDLIDDGPYAVYGASGIIGSMSTFQNGARYVAVVKDGAGVGRANLCSARTSVLGTMQALIPTEMVLPEYLLHLIRAMRLGDGFSGSTIPHIYFKDYGQRLVRYVSMADQERIVGMLGSIEDQIDILHQQNERFDTLVKSRFVEIFGSYSNEFETTLQDVSEFVTVGIANAATHAYVDSGVVMLRNLNVRENQLEDSDLVYIDPEFAAKYKKKRLKAGDILVTRTGYPGIACVVPKKYEGCQTFTTLIVRLRDDSPVTAEYVSQLINSPIGKEFVGRFKAGSSQQNFGATALKMMPIGIPPLALQQEFAAFVAEVDKSRFNLLKAYGSIIALFRVLFP